MLFLQKACFKFRQAESIQKQYLNEKQKWLQRFKTKTKPKISFYIIWILNSLSTQSSINESGFISFMIYNTLW